MNNQYSDLEVVRHERQEENPKYFVDSSYEPKENDALQETYLDKHEPHGQVFNQSQRQPKKKRMCGMPIKIFWIVVAIAVVVVVAAGVGGGVGGSLSSKHIKEIAAAQSSGVPTSTSASITSSPAATTSAPSTTSTSTGTPTTTEVVVSTSTTQSPDYTLLVDCPSSNWTVYTPPGTSQMFRKICQNALLNDNGIDAVVNQPTTNLDSCIQLCAAYNVQNASQIDSGASDICNAVCWRDTIENDDWPGQCFGYSTRNSTNNFILTDDTRCAGAALINQ